MKQAKQDGNVVDSGDLVSTMRSMLDEDARSQFDAVNHPIKDSSSDFSLHGYLHQVSNAMPRTEDDLTQFAASIKALDYFLAHIVAIQDGLNEKTNTQDYIERRMSPKVFAPLGEKMDKLIQQGILDSDAKDNLEEVLLAIRSQKTTGVYMEKLLAEALAHLHDGY